MSKGYSENVSIVDDVSPDGVVTQIHFEGEDMTVQRTWDADPHLKYAEMARQQTDGQNWGQGRFIGHIPPEPLSRFMLIKNNKERETAMLNWLRENPAFQMFHRAFK